MNKIKRKINNLIKEYIYLFIGTLLIAYSTIAMLLPNQLSAGGFGGLATIGYYVFKAPVGITMLILNIPLLIISIIKIGKQLFIKSIIGTILLSLSLEIMQNIKPVTNDKLLACLYGGVFMGIGTALVLKSGGSTGGTDLLSYLIKIYKPNYRNASVITIIDSIIILLNIITFNNIEIGLYSIIAIYITGKVIDIIFEGIYFSKGIIIISKKYKEISEIIGQEVKRGTTGIYSKGMYSGEEFLTLICISSRNEINKIKKIVLDQDQKAFIVIFNVREVHGYGFNYKDNKVT